VTRDPGHRLIVKSRQGHRQGNAAMECNVARIGQPKYATTAREELTPRGSSSQVRIRARAFEQRGPENDPACSPTDDVRGFASMAKNAFAAASLPVRKTPVRPDSGRFAG